MFCDYNRMKLAITERQEEIFKLLEINNMLLNNLRVKEEVSKKIKSRTK